MCLMYFFVLCVPGSGSTYQPGGVQLQKPPLPGGHGVHNGRQLSGRQPAAAGWPDSSRDSERTAARRLCWVSGRRSCQAQALRCSGCPGAGRICKRTNEYFNSALFVLAAGIFFIISFEVKMWAETVSEEHPWENKEDLVLNNRVRRCFARFLRENGGEALLWYMHNEYGWGYIAVSFQISPLCYMHDHTTVSWTPECIFSRSPMLHIFNSLKISVNRCILICGFRFSR